MAVSFDDFEGICSMTPSLQELSSGNAAFQDFLLSIRRLAPRAAAIALQPLALSLAHRGR